MTALIEDPEACEAVATLADLLAARDVDLPATITFEPAPIEDDR